MGKRGPQPGYLLRLPGVTALELGQRVTEMHAAGMPWKIIAWEIGYSKQTCYAVARRFKRSKLRTAVAQPD